MYIFLIFVAAGGDVFKVFEIYDGDKLEKLITDGILNRILTLKSLTEFN